MQGRAGDEDVAAVDAAVDERDVGGQRLAQLGGDERDRTEAGLGGVLAGDVGGGGAGRHQEVDRAEGSVHGEGEVVPIPASAPDAPRHVGQASRSLSSSDAHDG